MTKLLSNREVKVMFVIQFAFYRKLISSPKQRVLV